MKGFTQQADSFDLLQQTPSAGWIHGRRQGCQAWWDVCGHHLEVKCTPVKPRGFLKRFLFVYQEPPTGDGDGQDELPLDQSLSYSDLLISDCSPIVTSLGKLQTRAPAFRNTAAQWVPILPTFISHTCSILPKTVPNITKPSETKESGTYM